MRNKILILSIAIALFTSCERDTTSEIVININEEGTSNGDDTVNLTPATGTITEDTTLEADVEYMLTGATIVASGVTLTIEPGTIIKAEAGPNVYLAVEQGAQIMAEGTASNPIIFTSNSTAPSEGDWGGIILLGRAPVNSVTGTSTATSEIGNLPYGGNVADDNSGILRYVRVQYSGGAADGQSENNGFSFYGIGNGTTIEYIQAFEGADDGVEFFGGTVNANFVAVVNAQDDSIDWTEGYSGTLTNAYVLQGNGVGDEAFECDGFNTDFTNASDSFSNPTVTNVTIKSESGSNDSTRGFLLRAGTQGTFTNILIEGKNTGISVDDDEASTPTSQEIGSNLTFTDVTFTDVVSNTSIDGTATEGDLVTGIGNGTGTDIATWGAGWTVGIN